jgi:hypothetical protein
LSGKKSCRKDRQTFTHQHLNEFKTEGKKEYVNGLPCAA